MRRFLASFSESHSIVKAANALTTRLVRGREAILSMQPVLTHFAKSCGQPMAAEDLSYFLSKPGIFKRTPTLLLIFREDYEGLAPLRAEHLAGTLLLYEYIIAGIHTGLFTSNDRSGRNTLIAMPELRLRVVGSAIEWLLQHRASLIMFSCRQGVEEISPSSLHLDSAQSFTWSLRTRSIPDFLPLRNTYDETLACIGQRTRSNMRYYRRRAEKELSCVFVPEVKISSRELVAFNRECMYQVPSRVAAWRLRALEDLAEPILMGVRDGDGRWLSLLGGRRSGTNSEIFWQLNRADLPHLSLSLVLRSYFLEYEISRGAQNFYIEGGSSHPIHYSFQPCQLTDIAVLRHSLASRLARRLARHLVNPENDLAGMLVDEETQWQSSERPAPSPSGVAQSHI